MRVVTLDDGETVHNAFPDRNISTLNRVNKNMKLRYYPDTDSLYIELMENKSVDSQEIRDEIVIDLDTDGNIVGIDIDHAPLKIRFKND